MQDLFHSNTDKIELADAGLWYFKHWLTPTEANSLFNQLATHVEWQTESIRMFGRMVKVPRLVAWYGDASAHYQYSGVLHEPLAWTEPLLTIRERLHQTFASELSNKPLNSVLCNYYRNGNDSMGWHSDDEPELGNSPVIASLSLGATRYFDIRKKGQPDSKQRLTLQSGDLVIMRKHFQAVWQHQVPKQKRVTEGRINLTFRCII